MRILYVEDNEVNQALVERVLRAKKCSVVFREEGEGALDVLANDPDITLILLDIELAGSMNGIEVVRNLRARGDHRPVVAITAYAMMGDRERFLEAGCDQYLPKPLVITDLLNLIEDYEAQFAAKANGNQPARVITTPGNTRATQPAEAVPTESATPEKLAASAVPENSTESATPEKPTETPAQAAAPAQTPTVPSAAPTATPPETPTATSAATPVLTSTETPAAAPPSEASAQQPSEPQTAAAPESSSVTPTAVNPVLNKDRIS